MIPVLLAAVEDTDSQVHEWGGEVYVILPLVVDGQRGHC